MKAKKSKTWFSLSSEIESIFRITELYEIATKAKIPDYVRSLILDIMCQDLEGNNVDDVPYLKLTFR